MAPMKTIKATKGSKAAVRAVPKTASAAALAEGHERKRGVCSKTIDSLATLAAAEMKPATKAGKRETFEKEVMVKATTREQSPLSVLPNDSRGWMVLEVAAQQESRPKTMLKFKVHPDGGQPKQLVLVFQRTKMRVYVNPDPLGLDEWEMPPESGQFTYVGSPGNDP